MELEVSMQASFQGPPAAQQGGQCRFLSSSAFCSQLLTPNPVQPHEHKVAAPVPDFTSKHHPAQRRGNVAGTLTGRHLTGPLGYMFTLRQVQAAGITQCVQVSHGLTWKRGYGPLGSRAQAVGTGLGEGGWMLGGHPGTLQERCWWAIAYTIAPDGKRACCGAAGFISEKPDNQSALGAGGGPCRPVSLSPPRGQLLLELRSQRPGMVCVEGRWGRRKGWGCSSTNQTPSGSGLASPCAAFCPHSLLAEGSPLTLQTQRLRSGTGGLRSRRQYTALTTQTWVCQTLQPGGYR